MHASRTFSTPPAPVARHPAPRTISLSRATQVGYFCPIGGSADPAAGSHPLDGQLRLVHDAFELKYDIRTMMGVPEDEAVHLVAAGKKGELLDRIYSAYVAYKEAHDAVLVHGVGIGSGKLDAEVAAALGAPAIIAATARGAGGGDVFRQVMMKKALLDDVKVRSRRCSLRLSADCVALPGVLWRVCA